MVGVSMKNSYLKHKCQSVVGLIFPHTETVTNTHIPDQPIVTAWLSAPWKMPTQSLSR